MSSSTMSSQDSMYDRLTLHQCIGNLFAYVMDEEYGLPDSAIIEPLEGNARTNYGDYVFLGVSDACDEFRKGNPRYFEIEGPVAIAQRVKTFIESLRSRMIGELSLHEAGILTFRLQGSWIAERITNMLTNGMDTWAPKFFPRRVVFMGPRMMTADSVRSICITDVLANIFLYSGVHVAMGDFDDLALKMAKKHFTTRQMKIVSSRQQDTSYFSFEKGFNSDMLKDFYNYLATLWHGVHKQGADLMICMTPHRLRGYIQQCHVAATKEGLLPVDWEGIITCCGFRTLSGEQQELLELFEGWRSSRDSRGRDTFEMLERAGYSEMTFFECACKFTCLRRQRIAECTLKFEDLLIDTEGNTFGYILQTQLLVRSVIKNSPGRITKLKALSAGIEHELGLQLVEFTDAVAGASNHFLPDALCDYLCDLSKLFTRYYELLGGRPRRNMLGMCTATEAVMNKCCHLLGIDLVGSTTSSHHEWRSTLMFRYKEPRPTNYPIISLSEDRFEGLNSRFEIFSMNVRVKNSPFDKGSIYGYVLVLDTYRSRADGGATMDEDDNCFVSYFNREWYESEHINNDSLIPFGDPSCLHSIPFGSSIEVEVKLQATSDDNDQTYLLTYCKGTPPLSDFWLGDSDFEYGTIKYEGIDGRVYLNYGLIRDALDTKFELKLTNVKSAAKVCGDIVAYYGDAALGDRGLIGHYFALIFRANPTEFIGLEEDLPLLKSTLAVPVNGSLTIKARLTNVDSSEVIVDDEVEFLAGQEVVNNWEVQSNLGLFKLKVNWLSGSSQSGSRELGSYWREQ